MRKHQVSGFSIKFIHEKVLKDVTDSDDNIEQ